MTLECRCISYNRPDLGGDVKEIVVTVPEHIRAMTDGRDTVCLDLCIAPLVLSMWAHGIPTLNSCCGHRGAFDRSVIIRECDMEKARKVSDAMGDDALLLHTPPKALQIGDLVKIRENANFHGNAPKDRKGRIVGRSRRGQPRVLWDGLITPMVYDAELLRVFYEAPQ